MRLFNSGLLFITNSTEISHCSSCAHHDVSYISVSVNNRASSNKSWCCNCFKHQMLSDWWRWWLRDCTKMIRLWRRGWASFTSKVKNEQLKAVHTVGRDPVEVNCYNLLQMFECNLHISRTVCPIYFTVCWQVCWLGLKKMQPRICVNGHVQYVLNKQQTLLCAAAGGVAMAFTMNNKTCDGEVAKNLIKPNCNWAVRQMGSLSLYLFRYIHNPLYPVFLWVWPLHPLWPFL